MLSYAANFFANLYLVLLSDTDITLHVPVPCMLDDNARTKLLESFTIEKIKIAS
jgi:hypothetical protein